MPKIPTYQNDKLPPGSAGGVLVDPARASAPYRAAAAGWEKIGAVGNRGMALAGAMFEEEERLRRAVTAAKIGNELDKDVDGIFEEISQTRDYDSMDGMAEERFKALRPKYVQKVGEDRVLEGVVERVLAQQESQLRTKVTAHRTRVMNEEGLLAFQELFPKKVQEWVGAPDGETKQGIKDLLELQAEILVGSAPALAVPVRTLLRTFDNEAGEAYFRSVINTDAPRAVKELEDKTYLPTFDQSRRAVLLEHARQVQKVESSADKAKLETQVYSELYRTFAGDPKAMRRELLKPEAQKTLGIELDSVRAIEGTITDLEKSKISNNEEIAGRFLEKWAKRELKEGEVLQAVRSQGFNPERGREWIDRLRRKDDETTDPVKFNLLHNKLTLGATSLTEKEAKVLGVPYEPIGGGEGSMPFGLLTISDVQGLDQNARANLIEKFSGKRNELLNKAEAHAKTILERYIIPSTEQGIRLESPSAPERLRQVYLSLDKWRQDFVASGRPFDAKATNDYSALVSQLANQHRISIQEAMQEITGAMTKAKEKGKAGTVAPISRPKTIDAYEEQLRLKGGR